MKALSSFGSFFFLFANFEGYYSNKLALFHTYIFILVTRLISSECSWCYRLAFVLSLNFFDSNIQLVLEFLVQDLLLFVFGKWELLRGFSRYLFASQTLSSCLAVCSDLWDHECSIMHLLMLWFIFSRVGVNTVSFHIRSVLETTGSGVSVSISISVERRLAKVSCEGRICKKSTLIFIFEHSSSNFSFLLFCEWIINFQLSFLTFGAKCGSMCRSVTARNGYSVDVTFACFWLVIINHCSHDLT